MYKVRTHQWKWLGTSEPRGLISRYNPPPPPPPSRTHDEFATVLIEPQSPEDQVDHMIHQLVHFATHHRHIPLVRVQRYPLALCTIQFQSVLDRDTMFDEWPILLGEFSQANFIPHDELANRRNQPYNREGWVMILGITCSLKTMRLSIRW